MVSDDDRAHALQIGFHLGPKAIDSAALLKAVSRARFASASFRAFVKFWMCGRITNWLVAMAAIPSAMVAVKKRRMDMKRT